MELACSNGMGTAAFSPSIDMMPLPTISVLQEAPADPEADLRYTPTLGLQDFAPLTVGQEMIENIDTPPAPKFLSGAFPAQSFPP